MLAPLDAIKILFQLSLPMKIPLSAAVATFHVFGLAPFALHSAQAQDWSQYRGLDGRATSKATTVPAEFTASDYNWQVEVPGKGHSSPVIWGKKLILTSVTGDAERKVLCYNIDDGSLIWEWSQAFKAHNKHDYNEFASTTPCIDEKAIYVAWSSGGDYQALALNHDGQLLWERTVGGFEGDHGSGASPVLVGGGLFLFWDELTKQQTSYSLLNTASGEAMWKEVRAWPADRKELKTTYATPAIYENTKGETEIIITSMPFGVQSIDPKTGKEFWQFDEAVGTRTVGSPAIESGVILATWGSGNGAKAHIALISGRDSKSGKPEIAWRQDNNKGFPYVPSPIPHAGEFYMWADGGVFSRVDAKSGEFLFGPERVDGRYFSNPVLVGDKIYCGSLESGEMVVIQAGKDFKILARNQLGSGINATPAVAEGKMFIRTANHLISVGG